MSFSLLAFAFLFGLIVGSFLNVLILRRATGVSQKGRSRCASCSETLGFWDLIPLFSYLFLMGRCRFCKAKISPIYPSVELGTGLIFLLLTINFFLHPTTYLLLFISLAFWSLAFAISVYDLRHSIIPNIWTLWLAILAVLYAVLISWGNIRFLWPSILSGLIFFLFFFALWLVSRGRWMGLGDAKLAFALGVFIGIYRLFSAWALSFWIGALLVLVYFCLDSLLSFKGKRLSSLKRDITMKTEVPFGPFLFLGSFLAFLGLLLPIYGL